MVVGGWDGCHIRVQFMLLSMCFFVVLSINVTLFFWFSGRLECSTENVGFCQENWAANPLIFFIPWKRPRRSSDDHKLCRTTAPPVVISFSVLISRTFWKEGPHLSDVPRLFSHLFLCSTSYMQQNFKQRLYLMYIIQQIYQYVSVGENNKKNNLLWGFISFGYQGPVALSLMSWILWSSGSNL